MKRILGLSLLLLLLAACGIDNTMYNAQNYFKSAQARALNANGRPTPQAVDEYTKTIRKCGAILSENKNSRRADDALYLMARALYYKGNSAFQARDAFDSLIRGYPESKHVPDSYIYLGRVLRDINQPNESEALLERFVRNPKYIKHHPRALLVLADYEIKDKDYLRAQFWLERIIKDYQKTPEFKEAFFLFGKNYYMQKDYSSSLSEFQKFQGTRGIHREMKLEAQYYIALNQLELGDFEPAMRNVRYLIRNEVRPEKLAAAKVLYGRTLLASGKSENGLLELEDVTKTYPRTEQAAAAYYYWGEYLYYQMANIDKAMPHLNKVRTEFSNSPFASIGNQMATALAQIKRPPNLDSKKNLQAFLDYHYLKAEYFISPLALPDSALASYATVIAEYDSIKAVGDSLHLQIQSLNTAIDSLNALPEVALADSLASISAAEKPELDAPAIVDSVQVPELAVADTIALDIAAVPDSTVSIVAPEGLAKLELPEIALADSLPEVAESEADSTAVFIQPEGIAELELPELADSLALAEAVIADSVVYISPVEQRDQALLQRSNLQSQLDPLAELLERFESEILPFCHFSIFSIYHKLPERTADAQRVLTQMQSRYPRNMYTRAAQALKNGQTPRLVDPDLEAAEEAFDAALAYYPEAADSLLNSMQEFTDSSYPELQLRANYRLGWYYSFEAPDTTLATDYLEAVLAETDGGDYASTVRRFYDGAKYLLRDSGLIDSLIVADSLAIEKETLADTLLVPQATESDTLQFEAGLPDSLDLDLKIPEADSLSFAPADSSATAQSPSEDSSDADDGEAIPVPQDIIPTVKDEENPPE